VESLVDQKWELVAPVQIEVADTKAVCIPPGDHSLASEVDAIELLDRITLSIRDAVPAKQAEILIRFSRQRLRN